MFGCVALCCVVLDPHSKDWVVQRSVLGSGVHNGLATVVARPKNQENTQTA